ncbi:MAG: hypothetical protein U9N09_07640 [Euryarchaeota archaeon]|nr:hypothetical protein [Euryarchaeota archaeon]
MKVLLYFLLILFLYTNIASAYDEDDLEWACGNSKELHLGETISNGNFTVEAYNFPRSDQNETRFVGTRLYEDGILVSDQTLVEGEDYIYNEKLRITALEFSVPSSDWTTDLPEELWAEIKMEPIGVPRFDVEFVTDKDEYFAYSTYIEVDLTIQNSGDAEAYDVDVDMAMNGLEVVGGKSHYHCSSLEKGRRVDGKTDTITFDPITLRFGIPSVIEDHIFNLTVDIECYDIRGVKYSYSELYPVKVSGMFRISKSINDNIYMDEIATVTVSLRNEGTRPINSIAVSDTLPSEFEPAENSSLLWELDLGAGEYRSFTYQLKPMQPSEEGYVIPAAVAKWSWDGRTCTAYSNSRGIKVYGPKIELSKRVAPETIEEGGIVDVELLIKNTGNVLASIDVTDSLPVDAVLIDGASGGRAVLAAGESHTFGYRMRVNTTGYAELPPAVAHFADTHDYDGTVVSENISIMVNPVAHSARTIDTPDQMIPAAATANTTTGTDKESSAGSVCILVGFLAAVFVIMRVKRT